MIKFPAAVFVLICFWYTPTLGRTASSVVGSNEMDETDVAGIAFLEEIERMILESSKVEPAPSTPITRSPMADRAPTTNAPSPSPSARPSSAPTITASDAPSLVPSSRPSTLPSEPPSSMPTVDKYPQGRPPENKKGYFNYDPSSYEGPNHWGSVENPDPFYWTEFTNNGTGSWKGILEARRPWYNKCRRGNKQSPIDVRETWGVCEETHEIRDKPGIYRLSDPRVNKTIESNKLRITYPRRLCHNISNENYTFDALCQYPSPPTGDFPNGWRGAGDVIHVDFKFPGEHMIQGESFNGEMQIFLVHPVNQRIAAVANMMRAQADGFNYYMQEFINIFQQVYDQNQADCAYFKATGKVVDQSDANKASASPSSVPTVATQVPPRRMSEIREFDPMSSSNMEDVGSQDRDLQVRFFWSPFHPMLMPSIYFYRYDGSMTDPPCAEMVSWFVTDAPMIISFEQLEQLKFMLFTNVDKTCQMTSVHTESSVARAIQPTNNRTVWRCTSAHYVADPKW